jgi:hypothetical protein
MKCPPTFAELGGLWGRLPAEVRAGILAMAQSTAHKGH